MPTDHQTTFRQLAVGLANREISATELTEGCLARSQDQSGEGAATFTKIHSDTALATAATIDALRAANVPVPRFAGIPISVKDLFDVAGAVTTAGSRALIDAPAAEDDCPAVERLRAAGLVIIGRTNMTEFAYSGLGINPHYGTPRNPWDRSSGRIPGGSSSGAVISVTDGMAYAGLGSDTGGSCRIPAALSGTVGWKATAHRVPLQGVSPLSFSLDSVGCMAATVEDCAVIDDIVSASSDGFLEDHSLAHLRLAAPVSFVQESIDNDVGICFEKAIKRLVAAGTAIETIPLKELLEIPSFNSKGGFPAAESYAWHESLIEQRGQTYDPKVLSRILRGRSQSASDYIRLIEGRRDLITRVLPLIEGYDALVMPTVPCIAPQIAHLEPDDEYGRVNLLMLRNPSVANFLDLCSISLPIHSPGSAPVGLMLMARNGEDRKLLRIAKAIESAICEPQLRP